MSKLPLWLPPGFELGDQRRIPVLRIVGVEEGSPQAAELAERFAGSLRQFFVAQGRNQALGIAPQRNVRVDRGDHQIEYLNQFGQEIVTLHVHPSVMSVPAKKKEDFIPLDWLEIRVSNVDNGYAATSAYYVRDLYDPETPPLGPLNIWEPEFHSITMPPGVIIPNYAPNVEDDDNHEPYIPFDPARFWGEYFGGVVDGVDREEDRVRLDLRGFARDAVVSVDIYIGHNASDGSSQQQVGSELAASAAWQNGPDAAPFAPNSIRRYHDSTDWIASKSHIADDFPEYADLPMTNNSSFGFSYITTPLAKHGVLKYGTYIGSTGGYLGNPPPRNAIATARGGGYGKILETWPGTNHLPYNVSYGDMEYYPGTSFPRKQPYYYFYNSYTGDDTDLSDPPSAPSWDPAGGSNYDYSCEIGVGYVLYTSITDLVPNYVPIYYDIDAIGLVGASKLPFTHYDPVADERLLVRPDMLQLATDVRVDALEHNNYGPGLRTVAEHFGLTHVGTVIVDRKHHGVSFQAA